MVVPIFICIFAKKITMTKEDRKKDFIEKAKEVHKNENLDYSQVEYINNRTPVKIIDHDLRPDGTEYGEFWQTPTNHLKGQMHPDKKGLRISNTKTFKQKDIIKRFKEVHKNENLDYSQVVYRGMHVKVKIISHDLRPDGTEYGEFWQEPVVHLKGCTHPELGKYKQVQSQRYTTKCFIEKAKIVHEGKKYDYSQVNYTSSQTKVTIICNECNNKGVMHGRFQINPDAFLQGKGCPKCGNHVSVAEDEIISLISALSDLRVIKNDHTVLDGKELDIYLPDKHIAFEYNGIRWHSEQFNKDKFYHLRKKELCQQKGIKLFHIFEDEFLFHKKCLMNKIKRIIGLTDGLEKIGAKKCCIKEITNEDAKTFLEDYHIQGYTKATIHLGAFHGDELVSVISFLKEKNDEWNLVRSASHNQYIIQGITSKIISYFVKNYKVKQIKTFLDRRWEIDKDNNVYTKSGFKLTNVLAPDYRYTNGHGERMHKFNFRKQKLLKRYPQSGLTKDMTEKQMTEKLGFYRIWDCGLIKYVYTNPNYSTIYK